MSLLLPQHIMTLCVDSNVNFATFRSSQFWNRNELVWGQNREFKKTVFNYRTSNVPTFYSVPSNKDFLLYAAEHNDDHDDDKHVVFQSKVDEQERASKSRMAKHSSLTTN